MPSGFGHYREIHKLFTYLYINVIKPVSPTFCYSPLCFYWSYVTLTCKYWVYNVAVKPMSCHLVHILFCQVEQLCELYWSKQCMFSLVVYITRGLASFPESLTTPSDTACWCGGEFNVQTNVQSLHVDKNLDGIWFSLFFFLVGSVIPLDATTGWTILTYRTSGVGVFNWRVLLYRRYGGLEVNTEQYFFLNGWGNILVWWSYWWLWLTFQFSLMSNNEDVFN